MFLRLLHLSTYVATGAIMLAAGFAVMWAPSALSQPAWSLERNLHLCQSMGGRVEGTICVGVDPKALNDAAIKMYSKKKTKAENRSAVNSNKGTGHTLNTSVPSGPTAATTVIASPVVPMPTTFTHRVALVIGNSTYQHAPRLLNPLTDADAVSLLLKSIGFTVETRHDLSNDEMRRVIRDFSDMTKSADIALVYYAGHGIEVDGDNFLVPVDAALHRDIDVEDETVSLSRVLQIIESAKRLRLVILDACRENPFTKSMKRTLATRSIGRGLASVEPTTSNTLIAFAAKGGSTAEDGGGAHSPFTTALLNNIATPGLDLRIAFGRIRDQVLQSTGGRQEPFVYGSLGGSTVSLVSLSGVPSSSIGSNSSDYTWRDYEAATQVGTKAGWEAFLARYPTGFYADLARSRLANLDTAQPKEGLKLEEGAKIHTPDNEKSKRKTKTESTRFSQLVQCCVRYYRKYCVDNGYGANCGLAQVSHCKNIVRRGATHLCSVP